MKIVVGNLLDLAEKGEFDVIIHGCNCFCTMGSGIAKEVRGRWPWVYDADNETLAGDSSKLGLYTQADVLVWDSENLTHTFTVINAYTQYRYGRGQRHVDYNAVERVFGEVANNFHATDKRIAYPKIGAGLAGGDWDIVSGIIDNKLVGMDHTLVVLD